MGKNGDNEASASNEIKQQTKKNGSSESESAKPKKFLFVSLESLSGDVAWALAKEGHKVRAYIKDRNDADVYDGFIEKINRWEDSIEWADVIIFDDVEFGETADKLRKKGKPVIGGSVYTDRLEIDREFGQAELKKYGVNTLPGWQFSGYNEAIRFIRENPARYVFKPSGNVPSDDKELIFLGQEEDGRDLLEHLEQNHRVLKKRVPMFLLQKFIAGVEVAVGAFFNGKDFVYPINVNFEHKRVFPGNIGPFSGEMGTLMFWSPPNEIFRSTLERMLPALRESGYIGYIDINCIVNGRGIYPLEWTARFGYPTISIQLEGITMPAGEWLWRLARGENFELKTKRGFQVGVVVLVPSYFYGADSIEVGVYRDLAVTFKNPANLEGLHLGDIKQEDGIWRIAGVSGYVLVATGSGTTAAEARNTAYNRVKNIRVPNMFYRTDIGHSWAVDSDRLHTWGYLY